MKLFKIKVAEGKLIRHINGKRLRPGQVYTVPAVSYWLKRIKQNDVELVKDEPKPIKKAPKAKKEEKKEVKKDETKNEMGE
jgi:hypothetical protein